MSRVTVLEMNAGAPTPHPAAPDELLEQLPAGNLCVLGGPGSGKTALLESLLLQLHAAHPAPRAGGRGCLLVPTAGAARTSTERLQAASRQDATAELAAQRWYRFTADLVLRYHDLLAYRGTPRPLSGAEQWSLVRSLLRETTAVDWGSLGRLVATRGFADDLAHFLLACQRQLVDAEELAARAAAGGPALWRPAAEFYAVYEQRLALEDSVDAAGLVVQAGDLLERHAGIRAEVAAHLGTVLVDEAQTLEEAQRRVLRHLAAGGARVVLAGDPAGPTDASRAAGSAHEVAPGDAAPPAGALAAHGAALGASLLVLPGSRRLSGQGLDAVRRLARIGPTAPGGLPVPVTLPAPGEQPGPSNGEQPGDGTPGDGTPGGTVMEVVAAPGRTEEADTVARVLALAHQRDRIPYRRMAVLLPARGQTGAVRHALDRLGVPYVLGPGEGGLLTEPAVRNTLDLFRLAAARADTTTRPTALDAELLPRLLTSPLCGLDPHEMRAVRRAAVVADQPVERLLATPGGLAGLPRRTRRRITLLQNLIDRAAARVDDEASASFWWLWRTAPAFDRLVRQAARHAPDDRLRAGGDHAAPDRPSSIRIGTSPGGAGRTAQRQLAVLEALSRTLARFVEGRPGASMRTFLDVADRAEDALERVWQPPAATDAVTLLSVAAAKELPAEPDLVVVTGCLDGLLPRTAVPAGVLDRWRLETPDASGNGTPDPVLRARLSLDAERRRFVVAASRARRRTVFTYPLTQDRTEPSRFLAEAGLATGAADAWSDGRGGDPGALLTPAEAAGALRRVLTDPARPAPDRVAAAVNLAALPGADPATWWWSREWTHDPRPIAHDGRLRTSYTRLSVYEDCHLRYFYASVAGLDDQATYRMAFGKLMHTIFELAAKGEIGTDPAGLKAAFRERFDHSLYPSRAVAHQFWRDGLLMLRYWFDGEAELASRALAFEVGFEMEVGRHVIRGRIDRVDRAEDRASDGGDGIVLLDYKTGRAIPTEAEVAGSLQLAIYYLAALRDPSLRELGTPVEMQLVFPAEQRQRRFRRVGQKPGANYADAVERRLLPLLEGAAREEFDPNPHADCRWCSFKTICPLWPQGEDFLSPVENPSLVEDPPPAENPSPEVVG